MVTPRSCEGRAARAPWRRASTALGTLVLAGITFAGCGGQPPGEAAAAEPAPPAASVGALGRIEPGSEIVDIAASSGRLARLLVSEGEEVRAGEVLAELEAHDELRAARDLVAAQRADAEVRLRQARELRPLEIEAQRAKVRAAQAELENATKELERTRNLRADGVLPEDRFDREQLRVSQADEQLSVERAVARELDKRLELDVELAEARVLIVARELDLAEARLELTSLRAPIDGRILEIHVLPGESVAGRPLLQMGDTSVMHAVAEVYETDISRIRPGQRATVTSPALPVPLQGRVERVGSIIFKNDVLDVDPAAKVDARVVEVRIRMDDPAPLAGLTNLQVDVVIEVGEGPS